MDENLLVRGAVNAARGMLIGGWAFPCRSRRKNGAELPFPGSGEEPPGIEFATRLYPENTQPLEYAGFTDSPESQERLRPRLNL